MTLADTLAWLVDIPSVTGEEGPLCDALAGRLSGACPGGEVRRRGNSLVAGPRTGRPLVLLVGHIDTVPAQGQGPARMEGGRLWGLGASDMKSGAAVMVHLLEDPAVRNGPYDVVGVFYDAEEGPFDQNGLGPVLEGFPWLAEACFAVVMEPTDLELQLGCQGVVNASVRFEGKAAHSARPWLGENAVTKAGAWLAGLHGRAPDPLETGGLTFYEVFSVTRAGGGVAHNVIPASFELNLNYRFAPHRSRAAVLSRLAEITEGADTVEIREVVDGAPVPEGNPFLERLTQISKAPVTPKQAWTDVARLAAHGIPAVNYGPGETAQAHQAEESVPLANLGVAHEAVRRFLIEA